MNNEYSEECIDSCNHAYEEFIRCLKNNHIPQKQYDLLTSDYLNEDWDSCFVQVEYRIGHAFLYGIGCEKIWKDPLAFWYVPLMH